MSRRSRRETDHDHLFEHPTDRFRPCVHTDARRRARHHPGERPQRLSDPRVKHAAGALRRARLHTPPSNPQSQGVQGTRSRVGPAPQRLLQGDDDDQIRLPPDRLRRRWHPHTRLGHGRPARNRFRCLESASLTGIGAGLRPVPHLAVERHSSSYGKMRLTLRPLGRRRFPRCDRAGCRHSGSPDRHLWLSAGNRFPYLGGRSKLDLRRSTVRVAESLWPAVGHSVRGDAFRRRNALPSSCLLYTSPSPRDS